MGFPGGSVVKNPPANTGDAVGKTPWRREWQPVPVFFPGKSHGQRSRWATDHGVEQSQTQLGTHACFLNLTCDSISITE